MRWTQGSTFDGSTIAPQAMGRYAPADTNRDFSMTVSGLPFDDVRGLLQELAEPDGTSAERLRAVFDRAGYSVEGLGRIGTLALWLAEARRQAPPLVGKVGVALYAATHGFSLDGEDALAAQQKRVEAVAGGAAPISHLCLANDLALNVFDLALDLPSDDICAGAALDERGCAATIAFGMEATAEGADLLCLGTLGAQADVAAAAILNALFGAADVWTETEPAAAIVARALERHAGHLDDPLEVLHRFGGRDIAALTGAILAARMQNIPVILDGLPALAAAAVLHAANPMALAHCQIADAATPAQRRAAERLSLEPLLDFAVSAGGGAGAALAAGIVKSAASLAGGASEIARRLS